MPALSPLVIRMWRFLLAIVIISLLSLPPPSGVLAEDVFLPFAPVREGELDHSFYPGAGATIGVPAEPGEVLALALQPDGRILIGGNFTHYDGTARGGIARLHSNGSLDTTFNPGTGISTGHVVYAIALQSDGKILIGGSFVDYDGTPRQGIARLHSNGTLDTAFAPDTPTNAAVRAVIVQTDAVFDPDGVILIAGDFTTVDGIERSHLARLTSTGALHEWVPAATDERIRTVVRLADAKVLIGGYFTVIDKDSSEASRPGLARLMAWGALDTRFVPDFTDRPYDEVFSIVPLSNGQMLIGGSFGTTPMTAQRVGIARINSRDGSLDGTFGPANNDHALNDRVEGLALDRLGRPVIAGAFTWFGETQRVRLMRLTRDGLLDPSFNPGAGANDVVHAVVIQPDGRILIAGKFTSYDNVARAGVARVMAFGYDAFLPLVVR